MLLLLVYSSGPVENCHGAIIVRSCARLKLKLDYGFTLNKNLFSCVCVYAEMDQSLFHVMNENFNLLCLIIWAVYMSYFICKG